MGAKRQTGFRFQVWDYLHICNLAAPGRPFAFRDGQKLLSLRLTGISVRFRVKGLEGTVTRIAVVQEQNTTVEGQERIAFSVLEIGGEACCTIEREIGMDVIATRGRSAT